MYLTQFIISFVKILNYTAQITYKSRREKYIL